jgi:hypothetical protein
MPRFLFALTIFLGACSFDGRYPDGVPCGADLKCPSGRTCFEGACVSMIPIDMAPDEMMPPDMRMPDLTCGDPGIVNAAGGTVMGTTVGGSSKMSSLCGGIVNNGFDRVYRINMNGTNMLRVAIDAGARKAYVLTMSSCIESPSTPACIGNTRASMGSPLTITPLAGPAWVVVDDETAGAGGAGTYTMTLTVL